MRLQLRHHVLNVESYNLIFALLHLGEDYLAYFQNLDSGTYWSCSGCECICCDYCVEKGDIDNEKIGEDCGFYCNICREKFLKEKKEAEKND